MLSIVQPARVLLVAASITAAGSAALMPSSAHAASTPGVAAPAAKAKLCGISMGRLYHKGNKVKVDIGVVCPGTTATHAWGYLTRNGKVKARFRTHKSTQVVLSARDSSGNQKWCARAGSDSGSQHSSASQCEKKGW